MWKVIRRFIQKQGLEGATLLVGYSGGPDSKALLYALVACRESLRLDLHVLHVDHGWREESAREAHAICQEIKDLNLSFHLKKLEKVPKADSESFGRKERLAFFKEIATKTKAKGIFLAHHADDLAETVLKRVFEGAHLRFLGGMEEMSRHGELVLFRPFLHLEKKELVAYLDQKTFFEDPTNQDSRFLRGKMRKALFPFLNETFGKEVTKNLCRLSQNALELKKYFAKRTLPYQKMRKELSWGFFWDFSPFPALERLEMEYLLKDFFQEIGLFVSFPILEGVVRGLVESKKEIFYQLKEKSLYIDNSRLFVILKNDFSLFEILNKLNDDKLF